jgi:hypothetical protein
VSKGVVFDTPSLTVGLLPHTLMIATGSMQELRNMYEDLKKRVEQLGRFL